MWHLRMERATVRAPTRRQAAKSRLRARAGRRPGRSAVPSSPASTLRPRATSGIRLRSRPAVISPRATAWSSTARTTCRGVDEHKVIQGSCQDGIVHRCGRHPDNDLNCADISVIQVRNGCDQRIDVAAKAAGVRRLDGSESPSPVGDRIGHHHGLRRPTTIYRSLPDTGAGRDVIHAQPVVTLFGHTGQRGIEDGRIQRPIEASRASCRTRGARRLLHDPS